jgi:hypothetical protein
MYLLKNTFYIILEVFFSFISLVFWETHKMDFWHKALNTILIASQKRIIFHQDLCFSYIYDHLNENPHIYIIFLWNHMNRTFHMELKWYNQLIFNIWLDISSKLTIIWIFLNYIYTSCNTLLWVLYFHNFFNPLISIKCNLFQKNYSLDFELPYYEYTLWKKNHIDS